MLGAGTEVTGRELVEWLSAARFDVEEWFDDALEFSEALFEEKVIPFQESPLDLKSIQELLTRATGVTIGAYVGFVASGNTALLLITVPTGMIICGAAAGVATALEQGLRQKLLKLMGIDPRVAKKASRRRKGTKVSKAEVSKAFTRGLPAIILAPEDDDDADDAMERGNTSEQNHIDIKAP